MESALETEGGLPPQYHDTVLDEEPGRKIYMGFLSDYLCHQNRAAVVDLDMLGLLGEFLLMGTDKAIDEEIGFDKDAKLLGRLSQADLRKQMLLHHIRVLSELSSHTM